MRDARYLTERLRTAQVIPDPASTEIVAFGSTVTFSRPDGRVQTYRIVGEDEADPKAGSISFVAPVARSLMGKAVGRRRGGGRAGDRNFGDWVGGVMMASAVSVKQGSMAG